MNLDRLSYFTAVARHMNFTRAAEECGIAQTAMSRQISMLEDEIGFPLFERNNRTVRFTPAGKVFYEGITALLDLYDSTLTKAKNISRGSTGSIHIGIGLYEHTFVSLLVEEFHTLYPSVDVKVSQHNYQNLAERFLSGALDVIFALPISAEYFAGQPVKTTILFDSKVCIAMRKDHPYARYDYFPKDGWNTESFVTVSEEYGPCTIQNLYKEMASSDLRFGKMPLRVTSLDAALLMVEAGLGLLCVPDFMKNHLPPKLTLVPIQDAKPGKFVAISHKIAADPAADLFIKGIHSSDTLSQWLSAAQRDTHTK